MSDYNETIDRELEWDGEISRDSTYVLLPEGDYRFTVESVGRERYNGSAKLSACWKAALKLRFETPEGDTTITHNLFLHSKTEGLLCEFFTSIGARKSGEKLKMDWNAAIGASGMAHVYIDDWTNDKGETKQNNKVKRFLAPEGAAVATAVPEAAPKWQGGKF